MMSKMTLLKSSSFRRLLSIVLAVTLVIGLLPISTFAAGTGSTGSTASVEYTPKKPEVGILNAYTGTSTALYKEIRNAANSYSYWPDRYDAFSDLFGVLGMFTGTQEYAWRDDYAGHGTYADSTLRELSKVYGNLEVNISATFKNDTHTHTHAKGLRKYKYEITDYEKVYLEVGPYTPVLLAGVYPETNKDATKPMVGDYDGVSNENMSSDAKNTTDSYGIVRYSNDNTTFKVNFVGMDIGYYHFGELKTCTCNNTSADFPMMTFRDARAPQVAGVYYSLDNGENWTSSADGLRVKENSTLLIKLSFDEPIRFADDSATGKGDLYLELQADGTTTGYENRRAYLTKLDGNDLYFSYTFSEQNVDWNIQTLNMSKLFGSDLKLMQVDDDGSFTPRYIPSDTTGFTTTTCYITDLAGNAMGSQTVSAGNLNLDSLKPYVKNVQFNLTLNNGDVKKELGKTDPSDNTSYTDNSDLYLGVGDTLSLVLNMNERLKIDTLSGYTAVATTNIKNGENYITVTSQYFTPESEQASGNVTSWVMNPIIMQEGWTVEGNDGKIIVTALHFTSESSSADITDLAGNLLNKDNVTIATGANANPPLLDVTAPTVTPSGIETPEGTGFYYAVSISDDESGVAGLSGKFVLRNGTEAAGGDGKNYYFEYAVTGSAATPVDTSENPVWKTGKTGVAYDLIQLPTTYIHIRPKADETYGNLSACTFTVKTQDYAGNRSNVNLPSGSTLNWYIDNVAPTVKAGETTRTLKDDPAEGGTMTAQVILTDSKGIFVWDYGWSDSKTAVPASWTPGELRPEEIGPTSVTKTVTVDVENESLFSQYLWVKATDNSGKHNVSEPICLGLYTYDLSKAQYNLDYSTKVKVKASMNVSSIGENDSLFFLVKPNNESNEYALLRVDGESGENSDKNGNIFDGFLAWTSGDWSYGWTLAEADGIYTLTRTAGAEISPVMEKILNGTYGGEVTVVLLSGKKDGTTAPGNMEIYLNPDNSVTELVLGNGVYLFSMDTITLRAARHNTENFTGVTITTNSELGGDRENHGNVTLEHPALSTLAGIEFQISIQADNYGWNYDDVDWDHSYVELTQGVGTGVSYKWNLRRQINDDGTSTQTLTIPEDDYASGVYYAKLYIDCFAGYDIERYMTDDNKVTGNTIYFVVDNVKPVSDFTFTLTYTPGEKGYYNPEDENWYASNRYGINDIYENETRDCQSEDGVITLPVAAGTTFGTGYPGETYQFTVTSENEQPVSGPENSRYGWYKLQIWNKAYPNNTLTIDPTDENQKTVKSNDGTHSGSFAYGFVFDENKIVGDSGQVQYIYLEKDKENTVCIRKAYANGTFSDLQEVRIKPVTQHITGTVSVDRNNRQLVFTPDNSLVTVGARIYAWAWQNGQDAANKGEGQRIDMTPVSDGTWRCGLVENGAMYEVITINSAGSICDAGGFNEHAPIIGTPTLTDTGNGTYELDFALSEDYNTVQNGLKLDIGFNEDYSADHLNFTIKKGSEENWEPDSAIYEWTENGVSTTGISSVRVVKYSNTDKDYLGVTVKGCYTPSGSGGMTAPHDMQVTVTATDAMGYKATASVSPEGQVAYQQPVIYDETAADATLKPALGDHGLILNFSQPVQPADSWAWQKADPDAVSGFHTQWAGAFPIAGKGDYEVQFVDLFGNVCSQELTITDAFTVNGTDYSMDVTFSSTAMNVESVAVYASSQNGYLTFWEGDGSGTIWKKDGEYDTYKLYDKESGKWWPNSSIPNPATGRPIPDDELKNFGTAWREIRWFTNDKMVILCDSVLSPYEYTSRIFRQTVYISSIAEKTAPTAQVHYFAYELGQEFTQAELEKYIAVNGNRVTLTGNMLVWYETDRSVTPNDGGSEYLFTPETYQLDHTFTYEDELGNHGSVTVNLSNMGLTLAAPVNPPEDTIAPAVSVSISTKRSGSYYQEGSFNPSEDSTTVTQKFTDLGYVQGYLLTVNASDDSGFDIDVSGEGATLRGNMVTITKAGTFTITVTDKSTNNNATLVTFTVPSMIDNTPPTVKDITASDNESGKILTITLADRNDTGNDTGTVTLSRPVNAVRDANDENKYTYTVTTNETVQFEFYDQVGNRGTATYSVSGIDTEPSELSVSWSPARQDHSELPPIGPVKTDVTARIKSNKAMYCLTVRAANEQISHELLVNGVAQSYSILGPDNKPLVTFDVAPELVTVTYSGNYDQSLIFTAYAPNGLSTELTLSGLYNVIDKTAPDIQVVPTQFIRQGATEFYAVKVTLRPTNEMVTSPNYGATKLVGGVKQPVEYDFDNPLVLTFTENGVYNVRFVDKAGNVTVQTVDLTEATLGKRIDNAAPKLTVTTAEENNQVQVTVTVDEPCTLKWGENGTLTCPDKGTYGQNGEIAFTQNGTYTITATDAAGNESHKMVRVGSIDNEDPSISFTQNTIYVMQDSSEADLMDALNEGYRAWDNNTTSTPSVTHNGETAVNLKVAGDYTVTYTVTDAAGNVTTANRFVRVIGKDTVCLNVDSKLVLPNSTVVLSPGPHTLALENNNGEPYSIKARKGVLSIGQMKYLSGSSLSFDQNGRFNVTETGYYTLLVTTQSRQTIRILLYVEQ